MIIFCPHCQRKLKLPEDVQGKQVRCPSCMEIFRADHETSSGTIQAGMPAPSGVTAPPPVPEDDATEAPVAEHDDRDQDEPVRRRSRTDDEGPDDRDEDDPLREMRDEEDAIVASAKRKARGAGALMLVAGLFVLANVGVNTVLSQLAQAEVGPPPGIRNEAAFRAGQAMGTLCMAAIFLPMIGMIFWASGCLLTLRSRGIVITGVVMNFLFFLILGCGLAANVFFLIEDRVPMPLPLVLPTVVMNSISCILILSAASVTLIVLLSNDVREAYLIQADLAERRRRY